MALRTCVKDDPTKKSAFAAVEEGMCFFFFFLALCLRRRADGWYFSFSRGAESEEPAWDE